MKKKVVQHVMESDSLRLVRAALPRYWTIREYHPDYGVDLAVEVFDVDEASGGFLTAGEHLFIQVKAKASIDVVRTRLFEPLSFRQSARELEFLKRGEDEVDCVTIDMGVDELDLALSMSSGLPLMLFLVDLSSARIYFVSLTDYHEKIGSLELQGKASQNQLRIYIPAANIVSEQTWDFLRQYASRPKLYAFFNKVHFLVAELRRLSGEELLLHSIVALARLRTAGLTRFVKHPTFAESIGNIELYHQTFLAETQKNPATLNDRSYMEIFEFRLLHEWDCLNDFGRVHEDIHTEAFLPTFLGREIVR